MTPARALRGVAAVATVALVTVPISAADAAPSPPTGLHAQAVSTNKIALAWNPVADAKLYEFYRGGSRVGSATRNSPATVVSYQIAPGSKSDWTVRVTTADGQVSAQSSPVSVTTASTARALSSCQPGPLPAGSYTLANDITVTDTSKPCIQLGSNSALDCLSRKINSVPAQETNVVSITGHNVLVTGCTVNGYGRGDDNTGIRVNPGADAVTIAGNTITGPSLGAPWPPNAGPSAGAYGVDVFSATRTVISRNTFTNSQVGAFSSPGLVIHENNIAISNNWKGIAAPVWTHQTDDAIIGDNTIDGGAPGTGAGQPGGGNDDSIIITGPANGNLIRNNVMRHTYDAAVEPLGPFTNGRIEDNTISYVDEAGIGEYHQTWFTGNKVLNNKVDHSRRAFMFQAAPYDPYGLPDGKSDFAVSGNTFSGNTLRYPLTTGSDGTTATGSYVGGMCLMVKYVNPATAPAGNNVVTNNSVPGGTAPGVPAPKPVIYSDGPSLVSTYSGNTPSTYNAVPSC